MPRSFIVFISLLFSFFAFAENQKDFDVKIDIINLDGTVKKAGLTYEGEVCSGLNGENKINYTKNKCEKILKKYKDVLAAGQAQPGRRIFDQRQFQVFVKYDLKTWETSLAMTENTVCDVKGLNCKTPKPSPLRELVKTILDMGVENKSK